MKPIILNRTQKRILLIAAAVVIFLFFMPTDCSCNGKKDTVVPEIKGTMPAAKPESKPIVSTEPIFVNTGVKNRTSEKEVAYWKAEAKRLLDENQDMDNAFRNANDSLQQLLYSKAIQINSFTHTWDNDTLKATVFGISRGEVQSIKLDYTIKERKIQVPKEKEVVLRFMAGGGLGINSELNQPVLKANAGFQNKKGNIIMASYEKIGSQQYWLAEYNFSVFTIKR